MDRIAVGRTLRAVLLAILVGGALLLTALPAAGATGAGRQTLRITGHRAAHRRLVFSLRRVRGLHVVRAQVVVRQRRSPVTRRVRRGVRRGRLVLRMPRTSAFRRARAVLVVTVAVPPGTSAGSSSSGSASGPPAPTGARSTLQAPHAQILADADAAARVVRSPFEPRPANTTANSRVPTAAELAAFRAASTNWGACASFASHVTGNFRGTTDEIVQWAAWKWGLDEDMLRAVATKETSWRQGFVGDNGESFGLMQVKRVVQAGTYPLSELSTAFNVDYYAAILRYYYDGCGTWLNDVAHGQTYAAGDIWGAVGAWYSGRWHTPAAEGYIGSVRTDLLGRVWSLAGF